MKLKTANDARFLSFNPFPATHSTVTHKARVEFEKQLPRHQNNKFYDVKMSDSLYKPERQN